MSLNRMLANNFLTAYIGYKLRALLIRIKMNRYVNNPLVRNSILFNNFNGKGFGDNPRAIAEKLHEMKPDYQLFWACASDIAYESLPSYVTPVEYMSDAYYRIMSTSSVWVFNNNVPDGTIKKKGQLYIQTWHGDRGFKKYGYDAMNNERYNKTKKGRKLIENEICDYCLTGSIFGERTFSSAFRYNGKFLKYGMPKNDCLFNCDKQKMAHIKKELRVGDDKFILLYAPTLRDHLNNLNKVTSDLDVPYTLDLLEKKTGNKWICFIRSHSGTKLDIKTRQDNRVIDVTKYHDMADLLMIANILISDYSSSTSDFVITGRPVILYQDDYDEFQKNDREFYFDMNDSHYRIAHNKDELSHIIEEINIENDDERDKEILAFYQTYETGRASEIVSQVIIQNENNNPC